MWGNVMGNRRFGTQLSTLAVALAGIVTAACVTTSMQGYADRELPARPLQHLVIYVAASAPLASSLQANIQDEARKRGILAEDAFAVLPPTRSYSDTEVRRTLDANGVDGVLVLNVGDTGIVREYAGTFFQASYSGSSAVSGTARRVGPTTDLSMSGTSSGQMTGTSTPMYRYNRQTNFTARLVDAKSGRNLWIGNGQVSAGGRGVVGRLFVGDGTSAASAVGAIFNDLQSKRLIEGAS